MKNKAVRLSDVPTFRCPECGSATKVIDSRAATEGWRRRRVCKNGECNARMTTFEVIYAVNNDDYSRARAPTKSDLAINAFIDSVLRA